MTTEICIPTKMPAISWGSFELTGRGAILYNRHHVGDLVWDIYNTGWSIDVSTDDGLVKSQLKDIEDMLYQAALAWVQCKTGVEQLDDVLGVKLINVDDGAVEIDAQVTIDGGLVLDASIIKIGHRIQPLRNYVLKRLFFDIKAYILEVATNEVRV